MIEGTLVYASDIERLDIRMEDGEAYGGLSCGAQIDIQSDTGAWFEARVEYSSTDEAWYIPDVHAPGQIPYGLHVRLANRSRFL